MCPAISLPLLKRVLCNFSPDEFCPEPVSGAVLEAVNAEVCLFTLFCVSVSLYEASQLVILSIIIVISTEMKNNIMFDKCENILTFPYTSYVDSAS